MKLSRIDLVGQNGNDGLHYEYEKFLSQFNPPDWPTNLEFFYAACKFEREKIRSKIYPDYKDLDYVMDAEDFEEIFNGHES